MHAFIRKTLVEKYGEEVAENTSILYGGSCNASNAKELFSNPDVDGGLIGGASLGVDHAHYRGFFNALKNFTTDLNPDLWYFSIFAEIYSL